MVSFSLFVLLTSVVYGYPKQDPSTSPVSQCEGTITQGEREKVLEIHNMARSKIASGEFREGQGRFMPPAANMMQMAWDCDLERSAQLWAEECRFAHSNMSGLGENLYMVVGNKPLKRQGLIVNASDTWFDEFQKYGWDSIKLTKEVFFTGIGHATQMAWAPTRLLGCSSASCRGGKEIIVACHYKQSGNLLGENVYDFGEPCSACPSDSSCDPSTSLCL